MRLRQRSGVVSENRLLCAKLCHSDWWAKRSRAVNRLSDNSVSRLCLTDSGLYSTPKGFASTRNRFVRSRLPMLSAKHEPRVSIASSYVIFTGEAGMCTGVVVIMCCNGFK